MQLVIDGLAELCSLRDRDDLDRALVKLVVKSGKGLISESRLIRLVGDESQIRCITKAEDVLGVSNEEAPIPSDYKSFPDIREFPWRLAAHDTARVVTSGDCPELLEVPIFSGGVVASILEVKSAGKFPSESVAAIVGVARLYENFEARCLDRVA
jgi:hypothetical protein